MQLDILHITQNSDRTDSIQVDALKITASSLKLKKLSDKERAYLRSINACFKVENEDIWYENVLLRQTIPSRETKNTSRLGCLYWFSSSRNGTPLNLDY